MSTSTSFKESMPLDLHAKGSAPVRNIQIEPNLTKQKCQFVCYGQVQILWRAVPMACFAQKYTPLHYRRSHLGGVMGGVYPTATPLRVRIHHLAITFLCMDA